MELQYRWGWIPIPNFVGTSLRFAFTGMTEGAGNGIKGSCFALAVNLRLT